MLALSIRQPYAELILLGRKTIEYRTTSVRRMLGKRFYIYASRKTMPVAAEQIAATAAQRIWSDDLAVTAPRRGEHPPKWMLELAQLLIAGELPTGVIVGSAVIERCEEIRDQQSEISGRASGLTSDLRPVTSIFRWHLTDVERAKHLRKPTGHPQPVWFNPF
jgi:hypothetical protein